MDAGDAHVGRRSRSKKLVRARKRARLEAAVKTPGTTTSARDVREHGVVDDENQQQETITLPRTSAPWFSRTLSVNEETSFEVYYRRQGIVREDEWGEFLRYLRSPLPVTFRMNRMASRQEEVREALQSGKHLLQSDRELRDDRGKVIPPPTQLPWCDGWQLGMDKMSLKFTRNPVLRELQRWRPQSPARSR